MSSATQPTSEERRDSVPPESPGVPVGSPGPRPQVDESKKANQVLVHMNDHAANKAYEYPNNFIKTSKYNIITFLPLNLFHQFRKISNFYFLVNMVFALIPDVAPISPATAILPLVLVVGVALAKDGYEDFQRYLSDRRANSIKTHVVRKEGDKYVLKEVESADVEVGDITQVFSGEELRADIIVLSSSNPECAAFIDTCNLDGETNLKNRRAVEETWELNNLEACVATKLTLRTTPPSAHLLHWGGVLLFGDGREAAVGIDQFLYRSSVLRNTQWIWGLVAFAGVDTKMFKNLAAKPAKLSSLDVKLNYLIIVLAIFQNIFLIIVASLAVWWTSTHTNHWYIEFYVRKKTGIEVWGYRYLTYFILFSYMIPISLFVTIELCKLAQAVLMFWDVHLQEFMMGKWKMCSPNSSDLNEQLSQTKFIFSDKTGTLTQNEMKYKLGDVHGYAINADNLEISKGHLQNPAAREKVLKYLRALAICHTIQPFPDDDGGLKYEGSSPDEVALVEIAVAHGVVLKERTTRTLTLEVEGVREQYQIMSTLEFTPDRKMMSIVVKDPNGKLLMFTKGADSFVIPRMMQGPPNSDFLPKTIESLKIQALIGLRTLIVCTRDLTEAEYVPWQSRFTEAGKLLTNRAAEVDKVCLELESDMILVGTTAIEDKLQDKVPETLRFFLAAGVVIWMLTGDKRETAVTIAGTSSLTNPQEDAIIHIDIGDNLPLIHGDSGKQEVNPITIPVVKEQLEQVKEAYVRGDRKVTFVIDGPAITVAMHEDSGLRPLFIEVSQRVNSAVCCRLTPLQKANVVNMFQTETGSTALAIGDGANDVSMIQEGRVGVGIIGLEGAQAALAADYAIPRFKHLRRLACVHGRYATYRNALCIKFSFYKNILLSTMQLYFCFFVGFSGQTMFDGWLLTFYNVAFTSLPPMFVGFFEKDISEEAVMNEPELFKELGTGLYFNPIDVIQWFGEGVFHSLFVFWVMYPTALNQDLTEQSMDQLSFGTISISIIVYLVLIKLCFHIRWFCSPIIAVIAFSFCLYVAAIWMYQFFPSLLGDTTFVGSIYFLMRDAKFWFYGILIVAGLLIPLDLSLLFIFKTFTPSLRDQMREKYQSGDRYDRT